MRAVCLEQAEAASTILEREALLKVAVDCENAAADIESKQRSTMTRTKSKSLFRRFRSSGRAVQHDIVLFGLFERSQRND